MKLKEKEVISIHQYIWLLFSIVTSFSTLQIPGFLVMHSRQDAWLAILGAWFLDVIVAIILTYMGLRFPGENFVQYSQSILGSYLGKIIGIMFPLYFLLVSSNIMRALALLLSNAFIPSMPVSIPVGVGYLVIGYGVKRGIESMARVSEILGPLYFLSFIVLFILLSPVIKIDQLRPQLYNGLYPALTGTPFLFTYFGVCLIMGMYIPICNRPEKAFLGKFTAITMGMLVILMMVITSIGIFGVEQTANMVNPGLQITKYIQLGNFFERVEIIWMSIAIAAGILTSASLIWASSVGISQVVNIPSYKPLVYPTIFIAFALSVNSFKSDIEMLQFAYYSYPFIAIFIQYGLGLFLFLAAILLKKRGKSV